jgi:hypothetical protein
MNVTNKITETQLSKIFQQTRKVSTEVSLENLESHSKASDSRLKAVEVIADNSFLSASQQVLNKLALWTKATGNDLNNLIETKDKFNLFTWLKPGLVAMAFVTTMVFLNPDINKQTNNSNLKSYTDKIMFNSSFETSSHHSDMIINSSFEPDSKSNTDSQDIISTVSFG